MSNIGRITKPNTQNITSDVEEVVPTSSTYSQVYSLTHYSSGIRASNLKRSYISFSFGGKWIEDWNLIVTYSDRIERQTAANFEDLTSEYDVINGVFYWGTYFKNNTISFTLSTDGISQNQLEDFKNWFAPGETRELILAEHPNRAIMARVSKPIILRVIPFGKDIALTIGEDTHLVTIAEYKGEIEVEFTMDSPFWYAKDNIIKDSDLTKHILKIMVEDNIPCKEMIKNTTIFGDEIYTYNNDTNTITTVSSLAIPSGSSTLVTSPLIYYAGTAPSYPTISFTTCPIFYEEFGATNKNYYIINPANKYTNRLRSLSEKNYLKLSGTSNQFFYLSCPSVYTNFNEVISIFGNSNYTEGKELRKQIINRIKHPYICALALHFLNYLECFEISIGEDIEPEDPIEGEEEINIIKDSASSETLDETKRTKLKALMKSAFSRDYTLPIIYYINGQTGQITADIGYLTVKDYPVSKNSVTTVSNAFSSTNYTKWLHSEDISEIIQSDFLVLKERNNFSSDGTINYNSGKNILTHNFLTNLENFSISYKCLYF